MKGSDKIKYGKLIHDLSVQYTIKNNQYPKTLQEAVDAMGRVKCKSENNNDKSNTHKKMEVVSKINQMKQVLHKHRNLKR